MILISGRPQDVERTVKELHCFIVDKRPSPEPRLVNIDKAGAKFVLAEELMQQVVSRGAGFFKRVKSESDVDVKIIHSTGPPCKENEDVLIVSGKHRHVRRCLKTIVKQIIDIFDRNTITSEPTLKMLILSSHVKELIGPQGAIIKDISKKAGNARIKVLSDTETEKNQEFTIVNIDGSNEAKLEAACKVYELLGKSDKNSPRPSPEDEELKIFASVPDQYVARLIGRSGENVKAMMKSAKCKISFQKAPVSEFRNHDGEKIRLCFVSGNTSAIAKGVKLLLEQISKLEAS
jgi:transcription antitermination factor NusA-like protein